MQGAAGIATVLRVDIERRSLPVYNIEVHNQHVYQVGFLALLVHNVGHRCSPKAFGSDIPYGHKLLTNLSDTVHKNRHTSMNAFLKQETGKTLYAGKAWWTSQVSWKDRFKLMRDFHQDYDQRNNTKLFANYMTEVREGIKAGYNPLGR